MASLRHLPTIDTSKRASRRRQWHFTPGPSRLGTVAASEAIAFPARDFSAPIVPLAIHPSWRTFRPGPLPSFARARGSPARSKPPRPLRTVRTVATEILIADAARQRLRTLAKRKTTRAPSASATVVHGTIRYHALPYGSQPSTLFDILVPWDERVIAFDALAAEFTGMIPPHLQVRRSSARSTRFRYTDGG